MSWIILSIACISCGDSFLILADPATGATRRFGSEAECAFQLTQLADQRSADGRPHYEIVLCRDNNTGKNIVWAAQTFSAKAAAERSR